MQKYLIILCFLQISCSAFNQSTVKDHNRAVHFLEDVGMRDPYIVIGPDSTYHLTFTVMDNEHRQAAGYFTSNDLESWVKQDYPYTLANASYYQEFADAATDKNDILKLWAPEFHFMNGRWIIVHTSNVGIPNFALTEGNEIKGPYTDWGNVMGRRHDPNLFQDEDGSVWLIWGASNIQKIKNDLSGYDETEGKYIPPSNRKIGHEGSQLLKIGEKYVLFGTAWSTDKMRTGTYNLYYCTADHIKGPYGPRRFAGRCLGHGTIFMDKEGRWWCTAFSNGKYVSPAEVNTNGVSTVEGDATTMNPPGLTIVPMQIETINGDVWVRAKDPFYEFPGEEEDQDLSHLQWPAPNAARQSWRPEKSLSIQQNDNCLEVRNDAMDRKVFL